MRKLLPFSALPPASRRLLIGLLSCFALAALAPEAQAQEFGQVEARESNVDAYFYYVEPGEATINVKVIGTVQSPGLYVLGQDADLGLLLALSGGPSLGIRQNSRDRTTTIRLFRPQGGGNRELIYEATLEEGIAADSEDYPQLEGGDIMAVETVERQRITWREIFTITNTIVLMGLTITRVLDFR